MGGVRRSKRQVAVALEKSMDLYNFEDELGTDENHKLSFTSPKNVCKVKNKSSEGPSSVQKNIARDQKREISQKNGKGHFLHLSKSPSFEFFSKKQSKVRKSDSGIFMTPSPILKDLSNGPAEKPRSKTKSSKPDTKSQPQKQDNREEVPKVRQTLAKQKNVESGGELLNGKERNPTSKSKRQKKCDQKSVLFEADNISEEQVCFSNDMGTKEEVKAAERSAKKRETKVKEKLSKKPAETSIRSTRSSSRDFSSSLSGKEGVGRKIGKVPLHSGKLRSLKSRPSIARKVEVKKPTTLLRNSGSRLFKQHVSITRMVEESNRKHKIMTAPTSTPINLRPRTPKGVTESLTGVTAKLPLDLPEVSPVLKCGTHGAVVASPGNFSGLGSPQLKPKISTRSSTGQTKPTKVKSKATSGNSPQDLIKKPENPSGSLLKYVCTKETVKRKHTAVSDGESEKKKTRKVSSKNQLTEQQSKAAGSEELEVSMNLFEYSPEKKPKSKRKSPTSKVQPVEVESAHSSLNISKTYNTDSFTQSSGGMYKKKAGRYSTSRLDQWAELKNSEFDQLGSYELSIE